MKVIDVIIALQQIDPNMDVMIDSTTENMEMFHLMSLVSISEVGIPDEITGKNKNVILFSHNEL